MWVLQKLTKLIKRRPRCLLTKEMDLPFWGPRGRSPALPVPSRVRTKRRAWGYPLTWRPYWKVEIILQHAVVLISLWLSSVDSMCWKAWTSPFRLRLALHRFPNPKLPWTSPLLTKSHLNSQYRDLRVRQSLALRRCSVISSSMRKSLRNDQASFSITLRIPLGRKLQSLLISWGPRRPLTSDLNPNSNGRI